MQAPYLSRRMFLLLLSLVVALEYSAKAETVLVDKLAEGKASSIAFFVERNEIWMLVDDQVVTISARPESLTNPESTRVDGPGPKPIDLAYFGGTIWIATDNGLWKENGSQQFVIVPDLNATAVEKLLLTDSKLAALTSDRLFILDEASEMVHSFSRQQLKDSILPTGIIELDDGKLIIATERGLFETIGASSIRQIMTGPIVKIMEVDDSSFWALERYFLEEESGNSLLRIHELHRNSEDCGSESSKASWCTRSLLKDDLVVSLDRIGERYWMETANDRRRRFHELELTEDSSERQEIFLPPSIGKFVSFLQASNGDIWASAAGEVYFRRASDDPVTSEQWKAIWALEDSDGTRYSATAVDVDGLDNIFITSDKGSYRIWPYGKLSSDLGALRLWNHTYISLDDEIQLKSCRYEGVPDLNSPTLEFDCRELPCSGIFDSGSEDRFVRSVFDSDFPMSCRDLESSSLGSGLIPKDLFAISSDRSQNLKRHDFRLIRSATILLWMALLTGIPTLIGILYKPAVASYHRLRTSVFLSRRRAQKARRKRLQDLRRAGENSVLSASNANAIVDSMALKDDLVLFAPYDLSAGGILPKIEFGIGEILEESSFSGGLVVLEVTRNFVGDGDWKKTAKTQTAARTEVALKNLMDSGNCIFIIYSRVNDVPQDTFQLLRRFVHVEAQGSQVIFLSWAERERFEGIFRSFLDRDRAVWLNLS
ncbi:MAG: hypothetical protein AAGC60_29710 [Acidobacteriota bacterium]